jgi:hypothetical protein
MGRWFGYRESYADLCRIWLTVEAQHWYSHITMATEELRTEIRRMRSLGFTPKQFGLKVRAHQDSLIVTARNKMRLARTVERVISVSEQSLETPHLWVNSDAIQFNAGVVREFISSIERAGAARGVSPLGKGNTLWRNASKAEVAQLLRRFRVHPRNVTFQGEHLAAFLEHTDVPNLHHWDVVLPNGDEDQATDLLPNLPYRPQQRTVTKGDAGNVLVSGRSARVASRGAEREGIDPMVVREAEEHYRAENAGKKNVPDHVDRKVRPRPLLLIHCISASHKREDGTPEELDTGGEPMVALGLSFPRFDDSEVARRVKYSVNLIEWRSLFATEVDDEQDPDEDVT